VKGEPKPSLFGASPTLDQAKIKALPEAQAKELEDVQAASKRSVFTTIAILPSFMLLCYIGLFLYFRGKGGYKPVDLAAGH
jgi:hypothetical protein